MAAEITVTVTPQLLAHITCSFCGGMLREAVTFTECLHSACASCIDGQLDMNHSCGTCRVYGKVTADPQKQDIVTLLVNAYVQQREEAGR